MALGITVNSNPLLKIKVVENGSTVG